MTLSRTRFVSADIRPVDAIGSLAFKRSRKLSKRAVSSASSWSTGMNRSDAELMQYRRPPASLGPSGNTCPRWLSPCVERTSVRTIPKLLSVCLHDILWIDRTREARPAGAAVEFVGRQEQRLTRDDVDIEPGLFVVPIGVGERAFGAVVLRHTTLLGRELGRARRRSSRNAFSRLDRSLASSAS